MSAHGLERMVDANANRACEGVRVLEDVARFVLDDAALTERLKGVRHTVRSVTKRLGRSSRDTAGDVGTGISGSLEGVRSGGVRDIVLANARRAQEALRVIEEGAKALGLDAAAIERARYGVYESESALLSAVGKPCPQWRLCVLVTRSLCMHHDAAEVIRRASRGGADCVQLREKDLSDRDLFASCGELTRVAHDAGVHVVINDRADIAVACGADGVHIGGDDAPVDTVRRVVGDRWIGVTCDSVEKVRAAHADGADSVGVGPVFVSGTKRKETLGGVGLAWDAAAEAASLGVPMLAISGIDASNVHELAEVVPGVAVSGAVCGAEDPERVCAEIIERMGMGVE